MNFAVAVGSPLRSGYALPARRPNCRTLRNQLAGIHLTEAKRCREQADHLSPCYRRSAYAVSSVTVNQHGSSTVTETNGTTYNVATTTNAAPPTSLTSLASGETYIFDPGTTNVAYTITGMAGVSASAIAYDPKTSGTLTFTQDTTPGLYLPEGTVLSVPGGGDMQLTDVTEGTAPEQTLIDYLAQIGDPLTAAQLDADNFNFLNPTGTGAVEIGAPVYDPINKDADVTYSATGPDVVIKGVSTATVTVSGVQEQVPVMNELDAGGGSINSSTVDFAQDTISGIQVLGVDNNVTII